MKYLAIGLVFCALVGCTAQPDPKAVSAAAQSKLQSQLDSEFGKSNLVVKKIDLISVEKAKYEGQATVSTEGNDIVFPINVTSDGKNTLISPDEAALKQAIGQYRSKIIKNLGSKYANSILEPTYARFFPPSLTKNSEEFSSRLETVTPVLEAEDYYSGSGGMAHSFGQDEAAWAIRKDGSKMCAITMVYSPSSISGYSGTIAFHLFGCRLDNLPPPLAAWALDHEVSESNSVNMDSTPSL